MKLEENKSGKHGIGKAEKARISDAIQNEYENLCGIAVVRKGQIVYRQSFHGYDMDQPIHVASVTKSILSALLGIAVARGDISSVHQKAMSFFPEYSFEGRNRVREEMTIENLLNMTAPFSFADFCEPIAEFSMSPDWVRFALEKIDPCGRLGKFQYATEGAHLLSAILTRATGKSACTFANEALFAPIGMSVIEPHVLTAAEMNYDTLFGKNLRGWANDPQGITTGGWGLTLTPDDMAWFGLLYLNEGMWNGKQIIPKEWISASRKPNECHYAYLWWQLAFGDTYAFAAMGDGGNMICCIPEKQLVVAIASSFAASVKDRCSLISEHILPYFS